MVHALWKQLSEVVVVACSLHQYHRLLCLLLKRTARPSKSATCFSPLDWISQSESLLQCYMHPLAFGPGVTLALFEPLDTCSFQSRHLCTQFQRGSRCGLSAAAPVRIHTYQYNTATVAPPNPHHKVTSWLFCMQYLKVMQQTLGEAPFQRQNRAQVC